MDQKTIAVMDFWEDKDEHIFLGLCNIFNSLKKFKLVPPESNPDIMLCSVFGNNKINFNSKKIIYSGENRLRYDIPQCNNIELLIVSNSSDVYSDFHKEKIQCYPFFMMGYNSIKYQRDRKNNKKKFCCIVISNSDGHRGCVLREKMLIELSKYKKVDSGGSRMNNIGYLVSKNSDEYYDWINDYKFMITFENSFGKGYVTEKIMNGFIGGTVPIYWGDNISANKLFNPNSFLTLENDTDNAMKILIKKIIELDKDDEKYEKISKEYPYKEETEILMRESTDKIYKIIDLL